jgi:predicted nucleic acid-binding protein
MAYLLDANVLIQAKNLQYGFDFCPAFWDWLEQAHAAGRVLSVRHVANEIGAGADELAQWAEQRDASFFPAPDAAVLQASARVSAWVLQQGFEPAAVNTFFQVADYWIVAAALAGNHTVVTHEVASPTMRRIKIPNVCAGLGVAFTSPYQMLRREQARFVLGPAAGVD